MNKEYEYFKKKSMFPKNNSNKSNPLFDTFPSGDMNDSDGSFDNGPVEHDLDYDEDIPLFPQPSKKDAGAAIPDQIRIDTVKSSSSHKIQIRDVTVLFPFPPYDCQIAYMTKVIDTLNGRKNSLLQSPTGTGKTLCLLCATLAWMNKYREDFTKNAGEMDKYKSVKIFYSTRTHSQIKQVVKELKQTCYRPVVSILGSRNQLCVRSDFSELNGFQLNSACKAARTTAVPEQRCQYYDALNKNKTTFINQNKNNIHDIEELVTMAKKSRFCPYFLQRDLKTRADLIFLPYNYLLDSKIRKTMEVDVTDSIVIFDEAHNVESLAEEGSSFNLSLKDLENCEMDFKLLRQKMKTTPEECKITENLIKAIEYPIGSLYRNVVKMKKDFENEIKKSSQFNQYEDKNKGKVCAGKDIFDIFKGMTFVLERSAQSLLVDHEIEFKSGIDASNFPKFINYLQQAVDELSNCPTSKGGLDEILHCSIGVHKLLKVDLEIKSSFKVLGGTNKDWSQNFIDSYMLYIHFDEDYSDFKFSLWCLNPGIGFSFIKEQKPLSVILTSGTLTPMKSFESELMLEFPIQLVNNHVIDTKNQCYSVILRKGPANCPLNFSYERRDDVGVYNEMGTTLINIARLVPNGILVCFASYALMQKCFDIWQSPEQRILKRLEELKKVYREPKKANQLKTIMNEYTKDAKGKGAILCCVSRGKVSEGIDFADEMARAVVIVGIPFPPTTDIKSYYKVKHKRKFLDDFKTKTKRITGNDWYMQQAIRACNQAIGRVIRHVNDYGIVFLCDERYAADQFKNEFPNWIKDNLEVTDKFGFMVGKVATFFKDRNKPAALNRLISKAKVEPSSLNLDLPEERTLKCISVQSKSPQIRMEEESPILSLRNQRYAERPASQNNYFNSKSEEDSFSQMNEIKPPSPKLNPATQVQQKKNLFPFETSKFSNIVESRMESLKNNKILFSKSQNEMDPSPPVVSRIFKNIIEIKDDGFENKKPADQSRGEIKINSSPPGGMSLKDIIESRNASLKTKGLFEPNPIGMKKIKPTEDLRLPASNNVESNNNLSLDSPPDNLPADFRFESDVYNQNSNSMILQSIPTTSLDTQNQNIMNLNRNKPTDTKSTISRLLSSTTTESPNLVLAPQPIVEQQEKKVMPIDLEPTTPKTDSSISKTNLFNNTGSETQGSSGPMCIICYERKSENLMTSRCGHMACERCWETWLNIKAECPTCKSKVRLKQLIKLHF